MEESKDNVLGHMNYDFKNQTETFTPNPNFGKESKVKTVEFMSIDDCKKLVAKGNSCLDWQDALNYHMHKAIDETVVMYSSQFMTHITKLEAENAKLKATLLNIRDRTVKQPVIYNIITKALENEI